MTHEVEIVTASELPRPEFDAWYEPGFVSDYYDTHRDYHILRRRGSTTCYLVYCVSGVGFFRDAKDRLIRLEAGDLVFLEGNTYQEYGAWPKASSWKCHWAHFDPQSHWSSWLPLEEKSTLEGLSIAHVASRSMQQEISDLFFGVHTERKRGEPWSIALALNLLERILILVRSAVSHPGTLVDSRVSRVLQAIETSAPRSPSLAELSRIAGLSPSRLTYVFKQQTGTSILGAVNRVRLRAAQNALRDPRVSLADAAESAGFRSPFSFSNWYLKQTGVRPGEYQRRFSVVLNPPQSDKRALR